MGMWYADKLLSTSPVSCFLEFSWHGKPGPLHRCATAKVRSFQRQGPENFGVLHQMSNSPKRGDCEVWNVSSEHKNGNQRQTSTSGHVA